MLDDLQLVRDRLDAARNGHRTVASYSQEKVVEVDRAGKVVWQYQTPGFNPFLARKR